MKFPFSNGQLIITFDTSKKAQKDKKQSDPHFLGKSNAYFASNHTNAAIETNVTKTIT